MYSFLLFIHSIFRWLVLISLAYGLYRSITGYKRGSIFRRRDNTIRHITAIIAHMQLSIGYILYFQSPIINYFRNNYHEASKQFDLLFFGMIHITLMTLSIILITIGSSVAKRKGADRDKFKTIAIFWGLALIIILIAIPWPFSFLAQRPYLRTTF